MAAEHVGKKKSIIFITIYPFNDDYALKYGFSTIKKRGFDIIILNLFYVLFSKDITGKFSANNQTDLVQGIEQVIVKDNQDFLTRVRSITGWKISVLVAHPQFKLLRLLKEAMLDCILVICNSYPAPSSSLTAVGEKLKNVLKRFLQSPAETIQAYIFSKFPFFWRAFVNFPKYVVIGSDVHPAFPAPSKNGKVIKAHSFDFDRILANSTVPKPPYIPKEEYYVHLECPPWDTHDYLLLKLKAVLKKEEYAAIINPFHDWIEKTTGRKVIIAAHPKHTQEENVYGGRPFIVGAEQLVKYSQGVFCHYSGALKFAIFHRKPICFTSSRRLAGDQYFQKNLCAITREIGGEINFIDTKEDYHSLAEKRFFYFDEPSYAQFERKFITSNRSQLRPLWEIVLDQLMQVEGLVE